MLYPDLLNLQWHRPYFTALTPTSFANCRNGEIIYVLRIEGDVDYTKRVRQGFATSYATFMVSGGVGSIMDAFYDPALEMEGSVFNVGSDLYMGLTSRPVSGTGWFRCQLYKSSSGNGRDDFGAPDWVLHGTFSELNYPGGWSFGGIFPPGRVLVLSGGRWVCTHCHFTPPGLAYVTHGAVSTSDDEGENWTLRHNGGVGFGGFYTGHMSRNIVPYNGSLYCIRDGNTSDGHFLKGSSDGATWTRLYGMSLRYWNAPTGHDLCNNGDGYLHVLVNIYGGGWLGIYRSTDPDNNVWEKIKDYSVSDKFEIPGLGPLKNEYGVETMLVGMSRWVSNGAMLPQVQCKATNRILSAQTKKIITPIRF